VKRLARPRWWSRPPFLPLPAPDYLHFRLVTQYGTQDGSQDGMSSGHVVRRPDPADVLNYLTWCRRAER